jgi:hypothetical protein
MCLSGFPSTLKGTARMDNPTVIRFTDAVEASAFTVMVVKMVGEEYLEGVENNNGEYIVTLTKPLPEPWLAVIHAAIKEDQRKNHQKWENARAELRSKYGKTEEIH